MFYSMSQNNAIPLKPASLIILSHDAFKGLCWPNSSHSINHKQKKRPLRIYLESDKKN